MTKIQPTQLTDAQKRKWIETRSALLWACPAFTYTLFQMLNPSRGELAAVFTEDVPVAATDGSNLILNPGTFFNFSLDERVFIVAHEIAHNMFNHCVLGFNMRRAGKVAYPDGTALPYEHELMNVAMDLVINDMLIQSRIGKFPECAIHDPSTATWKDSFTDAYRRLWDKKEKAGGGGKGDDAGGGKGNDAGGGKGKGSGFDTLLDPGASTGQDPSQAAQERSKAAWDTAIAAAVAAAKVQGKLPAALERAFQRIIEPQVSWQDHIRSFFARKVGGGSYDWRRPDRRLIQRDIYAPSRSGNGCGTVVVAVDTSGSIGQNEIDVFFGELRGILDDVRPQRVHVVWCDAKVHKVDTVEDTSDIDTLKPFGGGGTDFRPVFEWIGEQSAPPDALVYLTDGLGSFPTDEPAYPVIWGSTTGKNVSYPFGEVVEIKIGDRH